MFDGDGTVLMANLDSVEPPKVVAEKQSHSHLTFSSDGNHLAAVETIWSAGQGMAMPVSQKLPSPEVKFELSSKRRLHLWSFDSSDEYRVVRLISSHTPSGIAWDSRLKAFVIGGEDGSVVLVDPVDGSQSMRMAGHRDATRVLTLPDGRFASFGSENKLNVWRIVPPESAIPDCIECSSPGSRTLTLQTDPQSYISKVQFSGDGQLAAVSGNRPVQNPTSNGSTLVTGSVINPPPQEQKWESVFSLHDPASGNVVDTIVLPDVTPRDFSLNHDGRYLAVYRPDGKALIWDRDQDRIIADFSGHQGAIFDICFHPDGQSVATAGQDGSVRIWSLEGKELSAIPQAGHTSCLSFSPDGKLLATGNGRTVTLWNVERREAVHTLPGHYGDLCDLSFSGDGSLLATSSRTYVNDGWLGDLKVWETATGKRTLSIPAHTWSNVGVAFHPTLPHIAITGKDHTLMMYHAETGRLLLSIPTGGYECGSVAFSPDGRQLLAPLANRAKLIDPTPDVAAFGNAPPQQETQDPAEESAARWILEHGGQVQVLVDEIVPFDVNQLADLPSDPYTVHRISLAGNDSIADSDLTVLHPLRHLHSIRLDLKNLTNSGFAFLAENPELQEVFVNGTGLTDKGLENFAGLKQLRVLHMNDTKVTGMGVMLSLSSCTKLENVEMHRTGVDDVSLLSVIKLKGLRNLGLSGTKITPEGIAEVKKVKPDLNIGL